MNDSRKKTRKGDKRKILVIVGPTASGKSALAVRLAKRLGGEIVSADSRQIYRGLEIGSNYPAKAELRAVPHHLIGFADPKKTFTAAEYQKKARQAIAGIWKRDKLPILVGGTGFYVQAAVDGIVMPEVPPNKTLRKKLASKSTGELADMLRKKDEERWQAIDRQNPRRLIRAIEIATVLGKVPKTKANPLKADTVLIGLDPGKRALGEAINKRSQRMIRLGFINETKKLLEKGVKREKIREFGFEYQDALRYLAGEIKSKKELADAISKMTQQYAKRQMTWFKRDRRIRWIAGKREAFDYARKLLYH